MSLLPSDDILTLSRVATGHLRAGRVEAGIIAYRALLQRDARRPDDWYNLGYLQRCARAFEDALASYGQALALGIARPEEAHLNRAAILADHLDRSHDAEVELGRALAVNPGFLIAWLNLGVVREDRGDAAGARAAYDSALSLSPGNGRALARVAMLDINAGRASETVARLGDLMPSLPTSDDIAEVGFALGQALDAVGDFDNAFDTFTHANLVASQNATTAPYDPSEQAALVARIIKAFPLTGPALAPASRSTPLFICGMFRSGSTLAEQVLARHPRVTAGGELELLPAMIAHGLAPYPTSLEQIPKQRWSELRDIYLREVMTLFPKADVLTDKRPDNFAHIGLIKTLFPDAKIIHTVRNPIDNIISAFFLHFDDSVSYSNNLAHLTDYYRHYQWLMQYWKTLYAADIYELDYDKLVIDPAPTIASLLEFCGLDWNDDCLDKTTTSATVRTASAWQVRQPLHTRSSGRWRNYERHLGPLIEALDAPRP